MAKQKNLAEKGAAQDEIERLSRAAGLRMTGPRKAVIRIIAETDDHPDIEELHRRAQVVDPSISLSTVYRNVKQLEDIGAIARHEFGDGRARVEPAGKRHHDHFIDLDSGEVIEFRSPEIERLQAEIAARHGFDIVHHRLELYVRKRARD
jgi:Fur family transcriptional regulator, ferric uptake regulator